jgi:hypothetical protein
MPYTGPDTGPEYETILPPWPYKTMEDWLNAKKEAEKPKDSKPFYLDFENDVFYPVV